MDLFLRANAAQASVSVLFGTGSVVNTVGVNAHGVHPVLFGFLRIGIAAATLQVVVAGASLYKKKSGGTAGPCGGRMCAARLTFSAVQEPVQAEPPLRDLFEKHGSVFAALCVALFLSQILHILGLALAGPITTSLWQPAQPVMTTLMAVAAGRESLSRGRFVGIAIAAAGCFMMVMHASTLGNWAAHTADVRGGRRFGNQCLCGSSIAWSLYILLMKPMLRRGYSPFTLATTSLTVSTAMFAIATAVARFVAWRQLCEVGGGGDHALCSGFWMPHKALGAALYMGVFATAVPFVLQFFAGGVLSASLVSAYSALQPVVATLATCAVIVAVEHPHHGVKDPEVADFWGLCVLAGLYIVVREESLHGQNPETSMETSPIWRPAPTLVQRSSSSGDV